MLIVITGTPGTGKSEVAKELAKITGFSIVDVKKLVETKKIFTFGSGGEKEVDIRTLGRAVLAEVRKKKSNGNTQQNIILENHMLCEFSIPADFVFVLRANPDILRKRLAKRKYRTEKLKENLGSEMLDYCTLKVKANYGIEPIEIDTSKLTAKQTAAKAARIIYDKNKNRKGDKVNYTSYLKKFLGLK
ncbi:MAG: AAA family ATPase [Candidatus Micrarchaeia archaeon]